MFIDLIRVFCFRVRGLNLLASGSNFLNHICSHSKFCISYFCRVSRKKTFSHSAKVKSLWPSKNSLHFFWTSWGSKAAKPWPTDLQHQPRPPIAPDLLCRHAVSVTREAAGQLGAELVHGVLAGSSCSLPLCLPGTSVKLPAIWERSPWVGSTPLVVHLLLQDGAQRPDRPAQSDAPVRGSVLATTWFPLITCSPVQTFSRRRVAGEAAAIRLEEV